MCCLSYSCLTSFYLQPRTTCPRNDADNCALGPSTSSNNQDDLPQNPQKNLIYTIQLRMFHSDDSRMYQIGKVKGNWK